MRDEVAILLTFIEVVIMRKTTHLRIGREIFFFFFLNSLFQEQHVSEIPSWFIDISLLRQFHMVLAIKIVTSENTSVIRNRENRGAPLGKNSAGWGVTSAFLPCRQYVSYFCVSYLQLVKLSMEVSHFKFCCYSIGVPENLWLFHDRISIAQIV